MIRLEKLNDNNMKGYLGLSVSEKQKSFIEAPMASLMDMKNRAWNIDWTILVIYNDSLEVGYLMYGLNRLNDLWLDRFMIDKRYQNKGYGKLALAMILKLLKSEFKGYRRIVLSVSVGNDIAIKFYQSFGFYLTGEIEDDELVMELKEEK